MTENKNGMENFLHHAYGGIWWGCCWAKVNNCVHLVMQADGVENSSSAESLIVDDLDSVIASTHTDTHTRSLARVTIKRRNRMHSYKFQIGQNLHA